MLRQSLIFITQTESVKGQKCSLCTKNLTTEELEQLETCKYLGLLERIRHPITKLKTNKQTNRTTEK